MRVPKIILNNYFTRKSIEDVDRFPISLFNNRLKSMISDLQYCLSIMMPVVLIMMIIFFVSGFVEDMDNFSTYLSIMMIPWMFILLIILNKDIAFGMSAGKRTFGFKIIDFKTKQEASQMQCMLRNVTMLIWPIEALMTAFNSKRRIGDLIAGTEVVEWEKQDLESLREDLMSMENGSFKLILVSLLFIIVFTAICFIGIL
ncbi:hypothetical protein EYV94_21345 [Puteibacter caeruleilacunae]|nr:hypothetical protein EYV94_21345 [Puteibacter caeruleilacunae]